MVMLLMTPAKPMTCAHGQFFVSELFTCVTFLEPLHFVVLWCDNPKLYFLNNHGKLCKCVLLTANEMIALNSIN